MLLWSLLSSSQVVIHYNLPLLMLQDYTSVVRLVCHLISLIYDLWVQSGYVSSGKIIPALCIYRGSGNLINPVAAKSFFGEKKTIKFNIPTFFLLFATGGWYIQSVQIWILLACWIMLYLIDMFNRMVNVSSTNIYEFLWFGSLDMTRFPNNFLRLWLSPPSQKNLILYTT